MFDLDAYLERIRLERSPAPDRVGLARVVRAHRLAIPFENLDVVLGRGISLDRDALFDKLVRRRRGGYCFEQNGLLEAALAALGFTARPLLARVWLALEAGTVPPVTHQLELVTIDGRDWIADAGFGGSFCPPMQLAEGETDIGRDGARHRLRRDDDFGWMLERRGPIASTDGRTGEGVEWQRQYSFTPGHAHAADREQCNHWTSTRPDTRFTSLMVASLVLEDGFLSLTNRQLRESIIDGSSETLLDDATAMSAALERRFGILLSQDEVEQLFRFAGR